MEQTYNEFIQNIIDTRGQWNIPEGEYYEKHHIIPKCMGGSNDKENIIYLYAREHFIAHKLLAEENPENYYLVLAWEMMAYPKGNTKRDFEITADEFQEIKTMISKGGMSEEQKRKIGESNKGRKHSAEARLHMSEAHKNIKQHNRTADWNNNISIGIKKYWSTIDDDTKKLKGDKVRKALTGRKLTDEHKLNISKSLKCIKKPIRTKEHIDKITCSRIANNDLSQCAKKAWETRKIHGLAKGYHINNGHNIMVKCIELNEQFNSIKEANEWLIMTTGHGGHIGNCLKGKNETAGGYHWEKLE